MAAFNVGYFMRPIIDEVRRPDVFALLETAEGIDQPGVAGAPKVFVAFDPFCSYCHKLYGSLVQRIEAGELQVEWVPVAFMKQESLSVATELLSSADPATSLSKWFGDEAGASPVIPQGVDPTTLESNVAQNTKLVRGLLGSNAAPAMFYRDRNGQIQVTVGVPSDLDGWLKELHRAG